MRTFLLFRYAKIKVFAPPEKFVEVKKKYDKTFLEHFLVAPIMLQSMGMVHFGYPNLT